jgi:N-formylglutamate amidohydrolase
MEGIGLEPKILWHEHLGEGPTLGLALHAGHEMRSELLPGLAIDETERVREEDPYTDYWTQACHNQIITRRSRFEVDLNREREESICIQPQDCWNLQVWKTPIGQAAMARSFAEHDRFFARLTEILRDLEERYGHIVIFDIHSYNHRRAGPNEPPADLTEAPEINIGTGTMNRDHWAPVVDRFIADLRAFDFGGRNLDVRENVIFYGGYLPRFVHQTFPATGCALAIEVKKFFMDEWTGVADPEAVNLLLRAFKSTIPGVMEALERM